MMDADAVDFAKGGGLVPCVTQDARTGAVLMLAYLDREALEATVTTGEMHYHSRSRGELWRKGETSGNLQRVVSLHLDCDGDTVLARVVPAGPACHTGAATCFLPPGDEPPEAHDLPLPTLAALQRVMEARRDHAPEGSWTAKLLADENLRLKKVTEEAGEVVMAAKDHDRDALAAELADLLYHALVAGRAEGVTLEDVCDVLEARRRR